MTKWERFTSLCCHLRVITSAYKSRDLLYTVCCADGALEDVPWLVSSLHIWEWSDCNLIQAMYFLFCSCTTNFPLCFVMLIISMIRYRWWGCSTNLTRNILISVPATFKLKVSGFKINKCIDWLKCGRSEWKEVLQPKDGYKMLNSMALSEESGISGQDHSSSFSPPSSHQPLITHSN